MDTRRRRHCNRRCHRAGGTLRKLIDCLIGAVAIRADVPILHADADFDVIAHHSSLRVEAAEAGS